jgi:hypothetical protein
VVRPVLGPLVITHTTNTITLNWTNGILQTATNVIGPYADLTGVTPPFTTNIVNMMEFYRLRCDSP